MINWTTHEELAARLNGYSPAGLRLRPFFHARYDADPTRSFPIAPEIQTVDGLGQVNMWSGLIETLPFTIASMAHPRHYGLEVAFPIHLDGDRVLLDALSELAPPAARSLYFETLPIGRGFSVVSAREGVIYSAKTRDDAVAAATLVERIGHGQFTIIDVASGEPRWIVVGPLAGPYVSEVEVFPSELEARGYAGERSRATGMRFQVRVAGEIADLAR